MIPSGSSRYARLVESSTTRSSSAIHPWMASFGKLAFSVRFIIAVCLLTTLALFLLLIWGRGGSDERTDGGRMEDLAQQRHAGLGFGKPGVDPQWFTKAPWTGSGRRTLRTLAPDVQLAISKCPHPREASPALLDSIRLLDEDPACKKALFGAACQLEQGLLYDATLPVTCPKEANAAERQSGPPRVLFVIDVNSGGARQVERLLIHLYRQTHYYLLLIPNCYSAVNDRLRRLRGVSSNIRLLYYDVQCPEEATADVSLPQTAETWRFVIENSTGWNWNYLLTLDSFDFPLLNLEKLSKFLERQAGTSFLESYGLDVRSEYVRNISSSACGDGRWWSIGEGRPPQNLDYFQGPPWYLLTRSFLDYALFSDDDRLAVGLRRFASMTPFPAQLLFHTLAHNGRHCHQFVNESLRLTKFHIFDQRAREEQGAIKPQEQEQLSSWTFGPKDFSYLARAQSANARNTDRNVVRGEKFFARRFDPTINQQSILDVESTLYDGRQLFGLDTPRLHSYWQTVWTDRMRDDRRRSTLRYAVVARLVADLCLKRLKRCPQLSNSYYQSGNGSRSSLGGATPTELALFRDFDMNDGFVLTMNISCDGADEEAAAAENSIPVQCYVNFQHREKVKSKATDVTDLGNTLLHMRVGSDYDLMDATFRNFAGSVVLDTDELFGLRTQWIPGEMGAQYQFAWLDPSDTVAGTTIVPVGPWTTTHFQPKSEELRQMQNGVWTGAMLSEGKVIGATEFLVLPRTQRAYESLNIKDRLRWGKQFFDVNRLCTPKAVSKLFATKCRCGPPPVPECETTDWSTLAPDPKSDLAAFLKRSNRRDGK